MYVDVYDREEFVGKYETDELFQEFGIRESSMYRALRTNCILQGRYRLEHGVPNGFAENWEEACAWPRVYFKFLHIFEKRGETGEIEAKVGRKPKMFVVSYRDNKIPVFLSTGETAELLGISNVALTCRLKSRGYYKSQDWEIREVDRERDHEDFDAVQKVSKIYSKRKENNAGRIFK